jgi:hypothetical protein
VDHCDTKHLPRLLDACLAPLTANGVDDRLLPALEVLRMLLVLTKGACFLPPRWLGESNQPVDMRAAAAAGGERRSWVLQQLPRVFIALASCVLWHEVTRTSRPRAAS